MGVREQIIFPEIDYDSIDQVRGLDVTITTVAATDLEAFALLEALGMPFAHEGRPGEDTAARMPPMRSAARRKRASAPSRTGCARAAQEENPELTPSRRSRKAKGQRGMKAPTSTQRVQRRASSGKDFPGGAPAAPAQVQDEGYNRCKRCGRPRAYFRKFGICRICLRELAHEGYIPGLTKSSW